MIGELAVSFCEKEGRRAVCLDLWSYPDGTYNLVLENFAPEGSQEMAFPCALHQLQNVLEGKPFVADNAKGAISIERCGELVCAEYGPIDGGRGFRHCIPFIKYREAIDALQANAVGYLA